MAREIEELNDEDLMELWAVIGGTPHLFEYGKDELKELLITGDCEHEIMLDFYTMAAIVDKLRERGFATNLTTKPPTHG